MSKRATTTAAPAQADLAGVRDLILVLADSKRLLGTRYAEWILGSPELETGIACASMAQDEWGHARLLYALLKEFGDDVDRLEHGREPAEYRNVEVLDRSPESWPEFVALNALVDTALTVQLEALTTSAHAPLRQRVGKLIDEEHFHMAHGLAWSRRLASSPESKAALASVVRAMIPVVQRWFGSDDGNGKLLHANGLAGALPAQLRQQWEDRIRVVAAATDNESLLGRQPSFDDFDDATRRTMGSAPDAATIARVRGDKNRAFLMD